MSVFGNIMSAVFGRPASAAPVSAYDAQAATGSSASPPPATTAPRPTGAAPQVDVAAVMDKRAEESHEDLDWRKSIVDLMKLLDLDSSLSARKQLAQELKYTGNVNDSASMNVWLHKQVMVKLAENGGNVPAELKH